MNNRIDFSDCQDETLAPGAAIAAEHWTIGEMSRCYGVSLRTLRFYEDRGLLSPTRLGAARFYDAGCRDKLERILEAKKLGFTLTRIQRMLQKAPCSTIAEALAPGEINAQIDLLEQRKAELDRAILDLRAAQARSGGAQLSLAG